MDAIPGKSRLTPEARAQEELARRTAMLDAVAFAATRVVASHDWRAVMPVLLARLGHATDMSRVTMFEVHEGPSGGLAQSCRYDWAEPGLDTISNNPLYHNMDLSDDGKPGNLDEWSRRRQRGEVVQATLAETTGYARQVFIEHRTLSFISVPIMVDGEWWGFLGFDDCRVERVWTSAEIDVLKTVAAVIASAIERAHAHDKLRVSEERYALAARGANDGLWDWDIGGDVAYFSPRLYEIFGLPDGAMRSSMTAFFAQIIPEESRSFEAHLKACYDERRERFQHECRLRTDDGSTKWVVLRGLIVYDGASPQRLVGGVRDITERLEFQNRLNEIENKRAILARYFSPNMVDDLMQTGGRLNETRTQLVTVLFVDIIGFTKVSAQLSGVAAIALLRDYLSILQEAVFAHGGTLDKFLGDGLMATFGTPRSGTSDATNAVRCARMMGEKIVVWNAKRRAANLELLRVGMGLHHGEVVLGDIGSERRMEFAVIGDTVNVAHRIEGKTRDLNIATLASQAVIDAVRAENNEAELEGFLDFGLHGLRGREGLFHLWGRAVER